jgi:hypothetical protein
MSKKFHYEEYERHERINLNLFAILSASKRLTWAVRPRARAREA